MGVLKAAISSLSVGIASMAMISPLMAVEQYSVKLERIEKIQSQEKKGDELYFSITEFPQKGQPRHYQIPSFPAHWLSGYLSSVNNVTLWQKSMQSCDETKVIFSLVEEDLPPWNLDDLLGSVELNLKCEQGKLVPHWSIPNQKITEATPNVNGGFQFKGDSSEYRATFKLEQKAAPLAP